MAKHVLIADSEAPAPRGLRYPLLVKPNAQGSSVGIRKVMLPGAWWRVEHAEHMLALRILRINGDWDAYWGKLKQKPAAANDNASPGSLNRAA